MFNGIQKDISQTITHMQKTHGYIIIILNILYQLIAGDECSNCTQLCSFSPEGLFCSCNDGYILDEDGVSCNGMFQYSKTAL